MHNYPHLVALHLSFGALELCLGLSTFRFAQDSFGLWLVWCLSIIIKGIPFTLKSLDDKLYVHPTSSWSGQCLHRVNINKMFSSECINKWSSLCFIFFYQINSWIRWFLSSLLLDVVQIKSVMQKAKTNNFGLSPLWKDHLYRISHLKIFTPGFTTLETKTCWESGYWHKKIIEDTVPSVSPTRSWII